MYDGIINIYKEAGFTSHDVVAKLRGILKQKKIGHTGTLDPDAEGVLPVCLGKGTKLCEFLTDKTKEYQAVLLLGVETDTQDAGGQIVSYGNSQVMDSLTEEGVRETIMSFVGPYEQIPPMYSALKVNGQKLCDLARAGKVVERKARPVEILSISIDNICLPRITMTVSCSKGTYIRTLCHDIGKKLGVGGCMEKLLRTRSGNFALETALTLGQVEKARDEGTLERYILPVDEVFADYPAWTVQGQAEKLVRNGNPFCPDLSGETGQKELPSVIRVYDSSGIFIGIYVYRKERQWFQPQKIFAGGQ